VGGVPFGVLLAGGRRVSTVPGPVRDTADKLRFSGTLATLADPTAFVECLATLSGTEWVIYAKPPFASPKPVLAYLCHYTHRVALADSRLNRLADGEVGFTWKDYRDHAKANVMMLTVDESMQRFLQTASRAGSTASAISGSLPMASAPISWRSAALCLQFHRLSHQSKALS
jgi:hypothetical protein